MAEQKYYKMTIAGLERELPICDLNDKLAIAGFIMLGDYELTTACAEELNKKLPEHDYMISPEAKTIALVNEMARLQGAKKHFVARKSLKAYMVDPISVTVNSITTANQQTLYLDKSDADMINGKRIIIVDDVISTGETLKSVEELVEKAGGKVVCKAAVLAEGDAADRPDIVYLEKLPLFFK